MAHLVRRQSGPVIGAVTVVGMGVGLAAMVFALADPYVARSLPYAEPDRLVSIVFGLGDPRAMLQADPADVPLLATWQARTDLFEGLAAFDDRGLVRVRLPDRVVPLRAVAATENLLVVLGLAGQPEPEAWISNRAATVLSDGALSAGLTVQVTPGGALRIGQVLPLQFLLPEADRTTPVDALVPMPSGPVIVMTGPTSARPLTFVGRMRSGVTPEAVEAALAPGIMALGRTLSVVSLATRMTARQQALAQGAFLASALVLVVCWMNVFNLALTRGLYRQPEFATRTALGATTSRLGRLVMADALRVATLGSLGAVVVTWVTLGAAVSVLPAEFTTMGVPSVTGRVATFIGLAGTVAWLCWCLASGAAWKLATGYRARHILSRDGRTIRMLRFGVIAGQVGAACVLLTAAALLGRSYFNLSLVDTGMDERAHTFTVAHDPNLPPALRSEVVQRVVAALRRRAGIQAVGVKSSDMLNGRWASTAVLADGQIAVIERVDRDFFAAAGLQFLIGGLPVSSEDGVVITEGLAASAFAGRSPMGALPVPGGTAPVVGVVRDVRTFGRSVPPRPVIYEVDSVWSTTSATFTYVVRPTDGSPPLADLTGILRPIDPMAVVTSGGTVGERLARTVRDRTFATLVAGLFATATILVTALGLAGVVAYTVTKRTREVAVRMTLGATRWRVSWLVVRDAFIAAATGAVGGLLASAWLTSALESLLYDVRSGDPATLIVAAVSLVAIVATAAFLPAFRTGRIAPATALRAD